MLAATLVACGEKRGELHAKPVSPSVVAACAASARVLCARVVSCTPHYVPHFFGSEATCLAHVTDACAARYSGPAASDAPSVCTNAANAPCSALASPMSGTLGGPAETLLRFCDVTPGRVRDGAHCLSDGECASSRCDAPETDSCGRCRATAGEGEECGSAACRVGLVCAFGRCVRTLDEGEACTKEKGGCTTECRDGKCVVLGKLGDDCLVDGCDLTHKYACGKDSNVCGEVESVGSNERCTLDWMTNARPGHRYCDRRGFCGDAGTCEPCATFGEPCGEGCHYWLGCRDGVCRSRAAARTSCVLR